MEKRGEHGRQDTLDYRALTFGPLPESRTEYPGSLHVPVTRVFR